MRETGVSAASYAMRINRLEAQVEHMRLSLRDQFAMAALPRITPGTPGNPLWIATQAYELADAMMHARELLREGE